MKHLMAVLALLGTTAAVAAPSAATGKTIFNSTCAGCHGAKATGGVGPSLKDASKWKYDLFKRALTQGKNAKGVALKPMMPKYPKGIPGQKGSVDDQFKSIQMYLKTLK